MVKTTEKAIDEISVGKRAWAELIGTFVLVFLGTSAVVAAVLLNQGWESPANNTFFVGFGVSDWVGIAIVFGIALTVMIYTFGPISGAHLNPAVSIALWATKRLPTSDMLMYVLFQCVGASLASLAVVLIFGIRPTDVGLGATTMVADTTYAQAILCEALVTFILMLTIMGSAVDKRAPVGFAGLAIGLVVVGSIIAIGNVTGGSLNPARTFGPYIAMSAVYGIHLWWQFPIYLFGPVIGATAAAFLYPNIPDSLSA